jgi:hypothetical protein
MQTNCYYPFINHCIYYQFSDQQVLKVNIHPANCFFIYHFCLLFLLISSGFYYFASNSLIKLWYHLNLIITIVYYFQSLSLFCFKLILFTANFHFIGSVNLIKFMSYLNLLNLMALFGLHLKLLEQIFIFSDFYQLK